MGFLRGLFRLCTVLATVHAVTADSHCFCVKEVLSNLRNPIHMESTILNGNQVYLIGEQFGRILEYRKGSDDPPTTYLDLTSRVLAENTTLEENGLLGFALHPSFTTNKKIYVYSIQMVGGLNYAVVSEVEGTDIANEKILLLVEQPGNTNNGGQLLFGDDGYLYVFVGDGGPSSPDQVQSQNGDSLLGKVLRLEVPKTVVRDNHLLYYDIPVDNPNRADWKPQIFAIGLRNMWRCSMDKGDNTGGGKGRIFCGEPGSNIAEEVNLVQKGVNYGWPEMEGFICLQQTGCQNMSDKVVRPIFAFNRSTSTDMNAIVAGPLYRANDFPDIKGQLVLGDFETGTLHRLKEEAGGWWSSHKFPTCDLSNCPCNHRNYTRTHLLSFGEDENGEMLLLMTDEVNPFQPKGGLLRLVPPLDSPTTCGGPAIYSNLSVAVVSLLIVLKATV